LEREEKIRSAMRRAHCSGFRRGEKRIRLHRGARGSFQVRLFPGVLRCDRRKKIGEKGAPSGVSSARGEKEKRQHQGPQPGGGA